MPLSAGCITPISYGLSCITLHCALYMHAVLATCTGYLSFVQCAESSCQHGQLAVSPLIACLPASGAKLTSQFPHSDTVSTLRHSFHPLILLPSNNACKQVNKYPCMRSFQAIGVTDPAFKSDMVAAVSSVVGTIHVECVSERPSKGGKYTAVRIGPVHVQNSDQVIQIFEKIKEAGGSRLKWYM